MEKGEKGVPHSLMYVSDKYSVLYISIELVSTFKLIQAILTKYLKPTDMLGVTIQNIKRLLLL